MSTKSDILDTIQNIINGVVVDGEVITAVPVFIDPTQRRDYPIFSVVEEPETIDFSSLRDTIKLRLTKVGILGWALFDKNKPRKGIEISEAVISKLTSMESSSLLRSLNNNCGASILSIGPVANEQFGGTSMSQNQTDLIFMTIPLSIQWLDEGV